MVTVSFFLFFGFVLVMIIKSVMEIVISDSEFKEAFVVCVMIQSGKHYPSIIFFVFVLL